MGDPIAYWLDFTLILVHFGIMCAPCIGLVLLVPFVCLCLPCVIKLVKYMNARNRERTHAWIKKLPTEQYDASQTSDSDDPTCSICLCEYEDKDELRLLPTCSHKFHVKCIDEWLLLKTNCPVCRAPVKKAAEVDEPQGQQSDGMNA